MIIRTKVNPKTAFTRKCIAEAIVELLEETSYDKLKVSAIVKRAGVARMTFYKYYDSPYAALTDYLNIIISEYLESSGAKDATDYYMKYEHILYALTFFDKYAKFFMVLAKNNMHTIMLDGINQFMMEHIQPSTKLSVYKMYSYAGGLLNTFLKWEETGKKDAAEDIAQMMYHLYNGEG